MNPIETYLKAVHDLHASGAGVKETSYYPALSNLFDELGKTLKPRVRCFIHLKNKGAGIPDGGLFAANQFDKGEDAPLQGQLPERGAIEVKSPRDALDQLAASEQVANYLKVYQQVLVTNLREFALVVPDAHGSATILETYTLAASDTEFWARLKHPHALAAEHADALGDYLKRVMLRPAPLTDPKEVAWFLASYARQAKARLEHADLPQLAALRAAMEQALGITFQGDKGERFFRSTLVQTLFYGIFSAWVLWHNHHPAAGQVFNWRFAEQYLQIPVLQALFDLVAKKRMLESANLIEVLDWTDDVLNRVVQEKFFASFDRRHAIQYFYEPFLAAYDPELRKELGVWYTPSEVIQYQVARVDTVLRAEFEIADGLADPRVYVLDPVVGTGGYVLHVLNVIAQTLHDRGGDALVAQQLKRAAMERVFGFEILPAPFVIAHLQIGLLLQSLGAPLNDSKHERAGVYLTNALTGWEPPDAQAKKQVAQLALNFPELQEEHDAAEQIKRTKPILVILGNPPYNAFAGVTPQEQGELVDVYKTGLRETWGIKKYNLDDLYVRFFRLAERYIGEQHAQGIVCYISNFSYLSDPSFVVLRERLLNEFDALWLDSMNGDSRETGKLTPDGKPDPSVFSTEQNREGIRVGTAIGLFVRRNAKPKTPIVRYREFWGVNKRADLLASLNSVDVNAQYEIAEPTNKNRFSFRPNTVGNNYFDWVSLTEICAEPSYQGLSEDRRKALIDADKDKLAIRMKKYFDATIDWTEYKRSDGVLSETYVDFPAKETREKIQKAEKFDPNSMRLYGMRPFDTQFCYYTSFRPIWRRHRPEFFKQAWEGNKFLVSRFNQSKSDEGIPFGFVTSLCDYHYLNPNASAFPIRLHHQVNLNQDIQSSFLHLTDKHTETLANLSSAARAYLAAIGITENPDTDLETAALIWYHALAIGYAPAYLTENADGIRQDFPRIPLPASADGLRASAALGKQIAALLDTETPVKGVTSGVIRPELKNIARISRVGGGQLNPDSAHLHVIAGWGHAGKAGVTMPAKGKRIERPLSPEERVGALNSTPPRDDETTYDIYLNDVAYWKNIPPRVWEYTIGGYQVLKKWLSYREYALLGRGLNMDEVQHVTDTARRIAAILLLEAELDANYHAVRDATHSLG